jgi:putative endonuclease
MPEEASEGIKGDTGKAKGFVYALRCCDDKIYVGSTRNLDSRLRSHQMGKVKTTKHRRPIALVMYEEFESYADARRQEMYLKTGAGRDWLKRRLGKSE